VASRQLGLANRGRPVSRRKRKALAIHVIAVRNLVRDLYLARLFGRVEFKGDGGIKEVIVRPGQRGELREDHAAEQKKYGAQRLARTSVETVKHGRDVGFR
jgi:exosortase/archaeosortase